MGVIARGALSPLGAALSAGDSEELTAACRLLLPAATDTARFGGDLTAVVTGTPSARLAQFLDATADREVSGTASLWRFSTASVRRALDAGHAPDEISVELTAIADGALPQPLSYLIADAARRHGHVRIAPAACVIHGDEPALLAELRAHRGLSALRDCGHAPVAEAPDGTVRVERVPPRRAATVPAPRRLSPRPVPDARRTGRPRHRPSPTRAPWRPGCWPPRRPPRSPIPSAPGSPSARIPRRSSPGTRHS
ncbi:helicase-associated domain-containing protein [Streptomyces sp. 130]|uniref:helicase-associated domain-containing protein n=1 Tax=Streptomyces sp. 130 TaxID=2591006 RepID=UPI0021B0D83A|nr:helicase-associated domain-containing protein [Streptomyces sp. 130]